MSKKKSSASRIATPKNSVKSGTDPWTVAITLMTAGLLLVAFNPEIAAGDGQRNDRPCGESGRSETAVQQY